MPRRQRSRLPHKPEVRRRRATARNIQRAASKNAVRIQEKYSKGGTQGSIQERRKFSPTKARTVEKKIEIDNIKIEILAKEESIKYRGQTITFQQQETTEIKNRIRAAWAIFYNSRPPNHISFGIDFACSMDPHKE